MGLQDTPSSERVQIGFFGCRNAGKSSLVNAVTNQEMAVVSPVKGTTTDPVTKAMELLPLGPVLIIDTPGIDDEGGLGAQRVKRTKQILNRIDCAILVVDSVAGETAADEELLNLFQEKQIPFLVAYNKSDLQMPVLSKENEVAVSALEKTGIEELKERIAALGKENQKERMLVRDLVKAEDLVVLVTPIDSSAPKGRLILPQQQTIRDLLEADAIPVVTKENIENHLGKSGKKACHGHYGQPGICPGQQGYTAGHSTDILFHSHGAV